MQTQKYADSFRFWQHHFHVALFIHITNCIVHRYYCLLLAAVVHNCFLQQPKSFMQNPLLLAISLLFFIPILSVLWSSDLVEGSKVIWVKLPLLLLPIALTGIWQLGQKIWAALHPLFLLTFRLM
ncbi:MAG: hypothetical protein ICV81_13740 [Flavisolibacter sp.]|nr:hypothetical protein [Flavisolibacter sp.]